MRSTKMRFVCQVSLNVRSIYFYINLHRHRINIFSRNIEYIMVTQNGGVDIAVDMDLNSINQLNEKLWW